MYDSTDEFYADAAILHHAQIEEARREKPVRFSAQVVESESRGRVTRIRLWMEPEKMQFPLKHGLEPGSGVSLSGDGISGLGFVREVDPQTGRIDLAMGDLSRLPEPGIQVRGEIRPMEFLIYREMDQLREIAADPLRQSALGRILCPRNLQPLKPLAISDRAKEILDASQRQVVATLQGTPDFGIVWGPPGTGKTETVAWLVNEWLDSGQTVLVVSFQHRAVDELMRRLIDGCGCSDRGMVRLGHPALVDAALHDLLDRERWGQPVRLVGCTLAACHSGLLEELNWSRFDHVVVDEAGRSTLAGTVPALLRAKKSWILVGDREQLHPIVPEDAGRTDAADSPLAYFQGIPEVRNQRTGILDKSYRFEGEAIARGTTEYYKQLGVPLECPGVRKDLAESVVFIDVGEHPPSWSRYGKSFSLASSCEAAVVYDAAHEFAEKHGGLDDNVWILTPFRLQGALIRRLLRRHPQIVTSIDKSQGGEKPVVIVSLVVDSVKHIEKYLPPEKMNVAWSRATQTLVLIGNLRALEQAYTEASRPHRGVRALVETIIEHGKIRRMQPDSSRLEKAEKQLEVLKEQGPGRKRKILQKAPSGSGTTLKELHQNIPNADRQHIIGVRRIRRRRR